MRWIVDSEPIPEPQEGVPTSFVRRTPEESRLPDAAEAGTLYDHIRMLDAPGYPHAFIDHGPWRISFTTAQQVSRGIEARAMFTLRAAGEKGEPGE